MAASEREDLTDSTDTDREGEEEFAEPDRSGLSASDFEPKKVSSLGRRLRFLTGWQVVVIVFAVLLLVPLLLAVVLNPLIAFLSRG